MTSIQDSVSRSRLLRGFVAALGLFVAVAWSGASLARLKFNPNGSWLSSSGNMVVITQRGAVIDITITSPGGQRNTYRGTWDESTNSFDYTTAKGIVSGRFGNDDFIYTLSKGQRGSDWTRRPDLAKAAASGDQTVANALAGAWRSTTGTTVHLTQEGEKVRLSMVGTNGQRSEAHGRWLERGRRFEYAVVGYPGTAVATVASSRQIDVAYNGGKTTWHRK